MRSGDGRGGSKKCKPIPALPHGAGLKSCPIPAPSPLQGGENLHGAKGGGAGQAWRGKIAIPRFTISNSQMCCQCFFSKRLLTISWVMWAYIIWVKKWEKHSLKTSRQRVLWVTRRLAKSRSDLQKTVHIPSCAFHVTFRRLSTCESIVSKSRTSWSSQFFTELLFSTLTLSARLFPRFELKKGFLKKARPKIAFG